MNVSTVKPSDKTTLFFCEPCHRRVGLSHGMISQRIPNSAGDLTAIKEEVRCVLLASLRIGMSYLPGLAHALS